MGIRAGTAQDAHGSVARVQFSDGLFGGRRFHRGQFLAVSTDARVAWQCQYAGRQESEVRLRVERDKRTQGLQASAKGTCNSVRYSMAVEAMNRFGS